MPTALVLTAITGSNAGKRHTFTGRLSTIGSAGNNNLVLTDRMIEPRHAEIHQMLDRWFIVPMSTDGLGLSLNGTPVTVRSRMNPGDKLTLGPVTYEVSLTELEEQQVGQPTKPSGVPKIGDYFLKRGFMSMKDIERTAKRQNELLQSGTRRTFGQVAYELGLVNRSQLETALADQRRDFDEFFRD
jgi:predicted component of type VI protein secretion system